MKKIRNDFSKYLYLKLLILLSLYMLKFYNYLLFHSMVELFTVIIAITLSAIVLNNSERTEYKALVFLGIAYISVGILDFVHILTYPGMQIFRVESPNISIQFWVIARIVEASSLLMVALIKNKNINIKKVFTSYILFTIFISTIVLKTNILPEAYIDGEGLTLTKILSEYGIILILIASLLVITRKKGIFSECITAFTVKAIQFTIASEFLLTLYQDVYGNINALGHILKVVSYYMIYKGVIFASLEEPYEKLNIEKARFFNIFEKAKDAILLMKRNEKNEHIIIDANNMVCQMVGLEKDMLLKNSIDIILHDNYKTDIKKFENSNSSFFETKLKDKNNNIIHVDVSLHSFEVFDQIIELADIRDVTKRKGYESKIDLFQSIFESALEAIFISDSNNRIIWINDSFKKMYGYDDSILNETPNILKSEYQDSMFYNSMWTSLNEKNQWKGEIWNKKSDGKVIPVYESIITIKSSENEIEYYASVSVDLTEKIESQKKMYELAYIDSTTNLRNLFYIKNQMSLVISSGITLIKINNYRKIVNRFGYEVGELLIKNIVSNLLDRYNYYNIFRSDQNRLIIVFESETCKDKVLKHIHNIIEILNESIDLDGNIFKIDFFIGSVINNLEEPWSMDDLIKKSESALIYALRKHTSNQIYYSDKIEKELNEEDDLSDKLMKALTLEEMSVNYQAIINIKKNELYGFEALARWLSPELGYIPPDIFIELAESNGQIYMIGEFVFRQSCKDLKIMHKLNNNLVMNINVSVLQLMHKGFSKFVIDTVEEYEIKPDKIVLEITENTTIENYDNISATTEELEAYGFKFALDDYGKGYSSIQRIKELPISIVKIDKSYLLDLEGKNENSIIISAMIEMIHILGLKVITEGVEVISQLKFIENSNCEFIQGYYFSKPVKLEEALDFIKKPIKQLEYEQ